MQCGRMPIHLAALRGQVDVIALLCDHGASLSEQDANGTAPLHKALGQGHLEAAQQLLAYGAEAEQTLEVLAVTSTFCSIGMVQSKPCKQCKPCRRCKALPARNFTTPGHSSGEYCTPEQLAVSCQDGTTPLHLAAYGGKVEAVQLLLSSGVSVEAQNCDGQTALFEAAAAGHREAAQLLLQAGADAGTSPSCRPAPDLLTYIHHPGCERLSKLMVPSTMQEMLRIALRLAFVEQAAGMQRALLPLIGRHLSLQVSCDNMHEGSSKPGLRSRQLLLIANPIISMGRMQSVGASCKASGVASLQRPFTAVLQALLQQDTNIPRHRRAGEQEV